VTGICVKSADVVVVIMAGTLFDRCIGQVYCSPYSDLSKPLFIWRVWCHGHEGNRAPLEICRLAP